MPRADLNSLDEFKAWVTAIATPKKYTAYVTNEFEVIMEPKTSTSPVRFAYVRLKTLIDVSMVKEFLTVTGFTVLSCARYEFNSERMVASPTIAPLTGG